MPRENKHYIRLSVILLDSIINVNKKILFARVFKKTKICKKKKIMSAIKEEIKSNKSDSESNSGLNKYQNISDGLH